MSLSAKSSGKPGDSRFPGIPGLRRFFLPALLLLAAGCLGPRSGDVLTGADPRSVLRVGTVADARPLAYVDDGEWRGAEADMGRALAERLGRRLEWTAYSERDLEDALRNGEIDIAMAGLAVTPERRAVLDFAHPYLASGIGALARAGEAAHYPTAPDLQSASGPVGVLRGSRAEAWAGRYLPLARLRTFDTADEVIDALRGGRIDLFLGEATRLWDLARRDPTRLGMAPALVDRTDLAWAFQPSSPTLREAANRVLEEWTRDGTLAEFLQPWLPATR